MHYYRQYRNGDPGEAGSRRGRYGQTTCDIDGCDKPHRGKGLCEMHLSRFLRNGDPLALRGHAPQLGPDNPAWTGDGATYSAVHQRLGRAAEFVCPCGRPAETWAYQHGDPDERVSPEGLVYSVDLDQYEAMCRVCHLALDGYKARPFVKGFDARRTAPFVTGYDPRRYHGPP
jgi:hypothetical protein